MTQPPAISDTASQQREATAAVRNSPDAMAHPHESHRIAITVYAIVVFLYWAALYVYVPTLPTYTQTKTSDLALVGVVLSMYGLWQAVVRLPLGIASDWLGRRKPFILLGIVLVALGAWTMGTADDAQGVLIGRAITGLAAGTWVPLVVVFSALFPPEEAVRASSLLTLIGTVARIVSTSITGSLNDLGGYSLAFMVAVAIAAAAMLIVLATREKPNPPKTPSLGSIGRLITRRDVLLPSLLSAIAQYVAWSTSYGFVPILAKELGASSVTLSLLSTAHLIVYGAGNLTATAIVQRIGARWMAVFGFVAAATGVGVIAMAPNLGFVFVGQILIGLGIGVGYPVLMGMSIRYVAGPERTTAMGLHQSVYAIGMFAGPWLSGMLAEAIGLRPMFGLTAFASLVVGLIGTRFLEKPSS